VNIVIALSFAFLASPFLGYLVLVLPLSPRKKVVIAGIGVALMIAVPLVVLLVAGGSDTSGDAAG
jgi:hypothetical protein